MEQRIPQTLSKHCQRMIRYGLYGLVTLDHLPESIIVQTKPDVEPHYALVLCKVVAIIKCKNLDKDLENLVHVRFANNSYKTFALSQVNVLTKGKDEKYKMPFQPIKIEQSLCVEKLWYPGCSWDKDRKFQNIIMYPNFDLVNQNAKRIGNLGDVMILNELEKYVGFTPDDLMSSKLNIFFDKHNPHIDKNGAIPEQHYTPFAEFRKMALMMKLMMKKKEKQEAEKRKTEEDARLQV